MSRNGRESQTRDELRREAADRLAAVKRTAAALEDRLRERTDQIGEVVDKTMNGLHEVDRLAHRYRYVLLGSALGAGFALGVRRRRRAIERGPRFVMVEPVRRPGVIRSFVGGLSALALRQGFSWLLRHLDEAPESSDPLLLPPAKPRV